MRECLYALRDLMGRNGNAATVLDRLTDPLIQLAAERDAQAGPNERLRVSDLLEPTRVVPWEADAQTLQFTYVGPQVRRLLGFEPDHCCEPGFWERHLHPDDLAAAKRYCAEQTSAGRDHEFEYRMRRADGAYVWVRDFVTVTTEHDGRTLLRGVLIDVSQRRQAEESLASSEERLRLAQQAARMGTWTWELKTNGVWWSPEQSLLLGYGMGEMPPSYDGFMQLVHPEDRSGLEQAVRRSLEQGVEFHAEFRVVWPDGSERWLEGHGRLQHDADGRPLRMIGLNRDITDRRRAEEALRDSEARFAAFMRHSPAVAFMKDEQGRYEYVNALHEQRFGQPLALIAGLTDFDLWPEATAQQFRTNDLAVLTSGRVLRTYERVPEEDGLHEWLVFKFPIVDRTGAKFLGGMAVDLRDQRQAEEALRRANEELGARVRERTAELSAVNAALLTEIDQRRQIESALRESEAQFRLLAENSTDMISRHAPDGTYLYASPSSSALFGYEPRELIGRSPYEFFHPDDVDAIRATHNRVLERAQPLPVTYRLRRRQGGYAWVESLSRSVREPATGRVLEIQVSTRDVTTRVQAEQALQEAQRFARAIVDALSSRIAILDEQGVIVAVNRSWSSFSQALGAADGRAGVGVNYLAVCEQPSTAADGAARTFAAGVRDVIARRRDAFEMEYACPTPEGDVHYVARVTRFAGDGPTFVAVAHEDITQRRRAEQEIRLMQEHMARMSRINTLGEMATGLAHELNQPLTAIINFSRGALRRLPRGGPPAEEIAYALDQIGEQAERAGLIIRSLRQMVKQREPRCTAEDINAVVREALMLAEADLRRNGVDVGLELDPAPPTVRIDRIQLGQVLLNLLRNAIEAMATTPRGQRRILIRTAAPAGENWVEVEVADRGPGLTGQSPVRIFDHFYTTKSEGLGIGLSISRSIIEGHGGRITAADRPDGGASFCFRLPIDALDAEADDAAGAR